MENFISKFGLTILCLLIIAIWGWNASKKFKAAVAENPFGDYEQPQTASILGVLGTFLGISVGLINFNPAPDAMQQSVINLLGGMTTAFFTSIFGMGISLYLKNYQANAQKNFHGVNQESTIADLIKYLEKSDAEKLNSLKNLIVGGEDTNIVHEFRNFSDTLAKSNSQALIDALNDAMKDFNQKLTEQFGENFKQFNTAVGRLLEWQENYKTIIEQITQNLQTTVEGIDAVKISVMQIEKSTASMTESSKQIQNLILTANFYEQKLEKVLAEVQALGESSKSAIPNLLDFVKISYDEMKIYTEQATANINSHVNSVTNNLKDKVELTISQTNMMTRQFMNVNNSALSKITDTTDQTIASMQKLSAELRDESARIISETNSKMNQLMNMMTRQFMNVNNSALSKITDTTDQTIASMQKLSAELRDESARIISETNSKMNQLMTTNDANLKKSLETLGRAMLKISDKFVEDYMPLVNELKKIVDIAKQVRLPARGDAPF